MEIIEVEKFKQSLLDLINNSNLSPSIIYYIYKDLFFMLENQYKDLYQQALSKIDNNKNFEEIITVTPDGVTRQMVEQEE